MQNRREHFRVACFLTAAAEEGMSAAEKYFVIFGSPTGSEGAREDGSRKIMESFVGYGRRALEKARAA